MSDVPEDEKEAAAWLQTLYQQKVKEESHFWFDK